MCRHPPNVLAVQIAAFLATFLPLWESREVLVRILVQAVTCNRASPEAMQKFGSFMGKPGVPRVRVSPFAPLHTFSGRVCSWPDLQAPMMPRLNLSHWR